MCRGAISASARAQTENANGVCVAPPAAAQLKCVKGHVPQGNQCVCPGAQTENANGVCVPPAAAQLKCVKGHVPRGNQCVCPGAQTENANGVCVAAGGGASG